MLRSKSLTTALIVIGCFAATICADEPKAKSGALKGDVKGDAKRGAKLFVQHCSDCHDGFSKEERIGPGLQGISKGKIPDGRKATFELLLDIINTGPAEMTSFKDLLTEQEKSDVVTYVLTL